MIHRGSLAAGMNSNLREHNADTYVTGNLQVRMLPFVEQDRMTSCYGYATLICARRGFMRACTMGWQTICMANLSAT